MPAEELARGTLPDVEFPIGVSQYGRIIRTERQALDPSRNPIPSRAESGTRAHRQWVTQKVGTSWRGIALALNPFLLPRPRVTLDASEDYHAQQGERGNAARSVP